MNKQRRNGLVHRESGKPMALANHLSIGESSFYIGIIKLQLSKLSDASQGISVR